MAREKRGRNTFHCIPFGVFGILNHVNELFIKNYIKRIMIKDVLTSQDEVSTVEGQGQAGMLEDKSSGQELGRNGWEGVRSPW